MSMFAADVVKRVLEALDPEAVLDRINYRPSTSQKRDNQIRCFCPIHKEAVFRTLSIHCETKRFRCSYTLCPGAKGGDLIEMFALARQISYDEAMRELADAFSLNMSLPTMGDYLQTKLNEGRNYLDMDAPAEAQEAFEQILKSEPDNPEAQEGLLKAYLLGKKSTEVRAQRLKIAAQARTAENHDLARRMLEEHLEENPEDDRTREQLIQLYEEHGLQDELIGQYMVLAERHEAEGQYDDALRMYRAVERVGESVVDVFPHIVHLLRESGRRNEAVAEHLKRAEKREVEGMPDLALENLGEALEIDPERGDIRLRAVEIAAAGALPVELANKAIAWVDGFLERKQAVEALEALEFLKPRLPDDERIEARMLQALESQGKLAEAEDLRGRIVDELAARGDFDAALLRLDEMLKVHRDSLRLERRKAEILVQMRQFEKAWAIYQTLLARLRENHDLRQALGLFDQALALRPGDLEFREQYRETLIELGETEKAQAVCLDLADRYLEVNRGEQALMRLEEAAQYAPEDIELRLRLAKAAERLGQVDVAVTARLRAAECRISAGAYEEAASLLEGALKLDPQNPEILDHLATCQQQSGDHVRACRYLEELAAAWESREEWARCEAALRRIIQIDQTQMAAREHLATILGRRGRTDEELTILQEAARHYLAESSYSRAEEVCKRIIERKPNHVDALEMLIKINEAAQKRQAAQALYRRLADIYHAQDDKANERKTFERILQSWSDDHEIRRKYVLLLWEQQDLQRMRTEAQRLIEMLLRLKRFDESASLLTQLQKVAPGEMLFHELAVDLYDQWGKSDEWAASVQALVDLCRRRNLSAEAAVWIQRLVERNPGDEALRAELIDLLLRDEKTADAARQYAALGTLHQERGALQDAAAAYQSALDLNPSDEEVMLALIRLHLQQKNDDEALRLIKDLASIREHREEFDEAIAVLRVGFETHQDSIELREKILEILLAKGAREEAMAELDNLRTVHETAGNWQAAIGTLRRKMELAPDQAQPHEELVDLLRRRGKQQERYTEEISLAEFYVRHASSAKAVALLEKLAEEDPSSMAVRRLRAEAYAANGEEKKALAEFMFISARLEELRPATATAEEASPTATKLSIVKDYMFENFITGPRNQFAYATSFAVAKAPGQTYNPLFLYSDVGLGKTHLLHAIANYLAAHRPELKLLYTSSDEFTSELVEAIENNTIKQFRARHKSTDVLLLDDVQFLAGKERAQEEFFHIFNTLFQSQRQIVVTSDRPPKDMAHLEKRLSSRFGAGVIVDIQAPDVETRVAILQREIKQLGQNGIPDSLAVRLAERLETNVRELKGAFNQIVAISRMRGGKVSDQELDDVISEVLQNF